VLPVRARRLQAARALALAMGLAPACPGGTPEPRGAQQSLGPGSSPLSPSPSADCEPRPGRVSPNLRRGARGEPQSGHHHHYHPHSYPAALRRVLHVLATAATADDVVIGARPPPPPPPPPPATPLLNALLSATTDSDPPNGATRDAKRAIRAVRHAAGACRDEAWRDLRLALVASAEDAMNAQKWIVANFPATGAANASSGTPTVTLLSSFSSCRSVGSPASGEPSQPRVTSSRDSRRPSRSSVTSPLPSLPEEQGGTGGGRFLNDRSGTGGEGQVPGDDPLPASFHRRVPTFEQSRASKGFKIDGCKAEAPVSDDDDDGLPNIPPIGMSPARAKVAIGDGDVVDPLVSFADHFDESVDAADADVAATLGADADVSLGGGPVRLRRESVLDGPAAARHGSRDSRSSGEGSTLVSSPLPRTRQEAAAVLRQSLDVLITAQAAASICLDNHAGVRVRVGGRGASEFSPRATPEPPGRDTPEPRDRCGRGTPCACPPPSQSLSPLGRRTPASPGSYPSPIPTIEETEHLSVLLASALGVRLPSESARDLTTEARAASQGAVLLEMLRGDPSQRSGSATGERLPTTERSSESEPMRRPSATESRPVASVDEGIGGSAALSRVPTHESLSDKTEISKNPSDDGSRAASPEGKPQKTAGGATSPDSGKRVAGSRARLNPMAAVFSLPPVASLAASAPSAPHSAPTIPPIHPVPAVDPSLVLIAEAAALFKWALPSPAEYPRRIISSLSSAMAAENPGTWVSTTHETLPDEIMPLTGLPCVSSSSFGDALRVLLDRLVSLEESRAKRVAEAREAREAAGGVKAKRGAAGTGGPADRLFAVGLRETARAARAAWRPPFLVVLAREAPDTVIASPAAAAQVARIAALSRGVERPAGVAPGDWPGFPCVVCAGFSARALGSLGTRGRTRRGKDRRGPPPPRAVSLAIMDIRGAESEAKAVREALAAALPDGSS